MTPTECSLQPAFSMSPRPHQVVVTRLKTMISTSSADEESLIAATAPDDDDGLRHLAEPEEAPELERRNSIESILSSIRHCSVLDSYSETDEFRLIDASPTSTISSSNRCVTKLIQTMHKITDMLLTENEMSRVELLLEIMSNIEMRRSSW